MTVDEAKQYVEELRKDNEKVADIMSDLIEEIEKDETKYIKMLAEGSEKAKNKLINHNLRLVAHISKKYRMRSNDCDDLISIGTIGLIKAVNTFKPDKGVRLSSYSARCIENSILT